MKDDGYTLAECLVALFVIGLSVAGLSASAMVIGRLQASAQRVAAGDRTVRAVDETLRQLLENAGPFSSSEDGVFAGSATMFAFNCEYPRKLCGAHLGPLAGGLGLYIALPGGVQRTLPLPGVKSAQFTYSGTRTLGSSWPPQGKDQQSLNAIGLMAATAAGTVPITSVRVWLDHSLDCQYDAIIQTCRTATR